MIRKWIPSSVKRQIRIIQRKSSDRKKGFSKIFASAADDKNKTPKILVKEIHQPIFYNPLSANKVANIKIAIKVIEQVEIEPGQIFSFWHLIGKPTEDKGYKTGRNIIGDRLQEDIGGGLCQVSGMLYHLALTCGMEIIERHSHTLDLYEEDKRYTPLGADATVVYGYKDIRFRNNSSVNIQLKFDVSETGFIGKLFAEVPIPSCEIDFRRVENDGFRTIETYRKCMDEWIFVNSSKYLLP
jgi:vancomycin resistance protein VanW